MAVNITKACQDALQSIAPSYIDPTTRVLTIDPAKSQVNCEAAANLLVAGAKPKITKDAVLAKKLIAAPLWIAPKEIKKEPPPRRMPMRWEVQFGLRFLLNRGIVTDQHAEGKLTTVDSGFDGTAGGPNGIGFGFGYDLNAGAVFPFEISPEDGVVGRLSAGLQYGVMLFSVKSEDQNLQTPAEFDDHFIGPYVKVGVGIPQVRGVAKLAGGLVGRNGNAEPLFSGLPRSKDSTETEVSGESLGGLFVGLDWEAGIEVSPLADDKKDGPTIGVSVGGRHIVAPNPDRVVGIDKRTIDFGDGDSIEQPPAELHITAPGSFYGLKFYVGYSF